MLLIQFYVYKSIVLDFWLIYDIIFVLMMSFLGGIDMGWIDWTLTITTIIVAIILTIVVMLQTSKDSQSSITGSNTFYGANKGKTMDGILSKYTVVLAIAFVVLCVCTTISILK